MNLALVRRTFWEANHGDKDGEVLERISDLIERGADVHATDDEGKTALHHAAGSGIGPEVISLLVENGTNVNATDNSNRTPIFYAVSNGASPEVIVSLLESGAKVNSPVEEKLTLVQIGIESKASPAVIGLLLGITMDETTVTQARKESFNLALREYFSSSSAQTFMRTVVGFLKVIDPRHVELIDIYIESLSSAADCETRIQKDILLPRQIAHEIRLGNKLDILESTSHEAKFALERAGIPISDSKISLLKRERQKTIKSATEFFKKQSYKTVLAREQEATCEGVLELTKASFVEETSKDIGNCFIRFEFPPPKEELAAAAMICPNRRARLAEASTLRDLSWGVKERNLSILEEAKEGADQLIHDNQGKCLQHHMPFLQVTVVACIEELIYERERNHIASMMEKRELEPLRVAVANLPDLKGNRFAGKLFSFLRTTVEPLIQRLEFEAAIAPLQDAVKGQEQNALESAVANVAILKEGSPFKCELDAFVEKTKDLLDFVTYRNELREIPDQVRLYAVPRDVFLDMHERGEGLVVFQDLRKANKLQVVKVDKQDVLKGYLRGKGKGSCKLLAISYPWEGLGNPDSTGERIEVVARFLQANTQVEYVWWDFMCMPQNTNWQDYQPEKQYRNKFIKNEFEKLYFDMMLDRGDINLVYLGAHVLSITNSLYLNKFWTQYEYFLATRVVTNRGFEVSYHRSYVRCIESLKDLTEVQEDSMRAKWGEATTEGAIKVLEQNDVPATNFSDKRLLAKLLSFEGNMKKYFAELPNDAKLDLQDELERDQQAQIMRKASDLLRIALEAEGYADSLEKELADLTFKSFGRGNAKILPK